MKSVGEKTASLFECKKDDAADTAEAAQEMAKDQAERAGKALGDTKDAAKDMTNNASKSLMF